MFSLGEIAAIVHGERTNRGGRTPRRIVHDSRCVEPGDLFVALPGARTDGHEHLADAFRRGACGAIVSDPSRAPDSVHGLVVVPDTLVALQTLAAAWRDRSSATIVGITGSNGKTTTRSLLAHLLRDTSSVHEPPENYNTEIGLPLALLAMPGDSDVGVFELATEAPGEIRRLAEILRPSAALLTGVGPSHLEGFGSIDAIVAEKWSLVDTMAPEGLAFVNAESTPLRTRIATAGRTLVTVGLHEGEFRGHITSVVPRLSVVIDEPPLELRTGLLGEHNATNVLLAVACALRLGTSPATIEERTRTFEPIRQRLKAISAPFGTVLDDTYNANPASTRAALRVLAAFGTPRSRRLFLFGDMLGLGARSADYHTEILGFALGLGVDVIPIGSRARAACTTAASDRIALLEPDSVSEAIRRRLAGPEDVVLVKGSRALGLERIVAALLETD